jgi:hypothetical protein
MISISSTKINDAIARVTFFSNFAFMCVNTSATRDNLMACFGWFSFFLNDNFSAERWPWLLYSVYNTTDEPAEGRHQNVTTRITESQWHDWRIFRRYTHRPKLSLLFQLTLDKEQSNLYLYLSFVTLYNRNNCEWLYTCDCNNNNHIKIEYLTTGPNWTYFPLHL